MSIPKVSGQGPTTRDQGNAAVLALAVIMLAAIIVVGLLVNLIRIGNDTRDDIRSYTHSPVACAERLGIRWSPEDGATERPDEFRRCVEIGGGGK